MRWCEIMAIFFLGFSAIVLLAIGLAKLFG